MPRHSRGSLAPSGLWLLQRVCCIGPLPPHLTGRAALRLPIPIGLVP